MTVVSASLGILLFGVAGYIAEPYLRQRSTAATGVDTETLQSQQSLEDAPLDLTKWTDDQLPKKVQIKRDVEVRATNSDVPMIVPAGARVTLVRRSQDQLIISSAPGLEGSIAAADTDLFRQLRSQPVASATVPPLTVEPTSQPAANTEVAVVTEPTAEPTATAATTTEPSVVEPTPAVTEPAPESIPVTNVTLNADQIVSSMQASINAQQVKKFAYSAVTSWKAGESEEIDGQTYQTGLVTYKDQTIFGVKNIQAKALILNGKVQRWIWPTSGLEIP